MMYLSKGIRTVASREYLEYVGRAANEVCFIFELRGMV